MRLDRQTATNMMTNLHRIRRDKGLCSNADPVSFYGFTPDDIHSIHLWKGKEEGIWFRLNDGRVISEAAEPCDPDISLYGNPSSRALNG